jgi:hypothetical protein
MATPTLPRPGVKVFTEFRTVSPNLIIPQMPACVIGVAKEIVEAVLNDGSLNSSALLSLPARIEFPYVTSAYTALGTQTLLISVNNGPTRTLTFPGTNPTVAEVKAYIDGLAITGLAVDIEEKGTQSRIVLRTNTSGDFASIAVMSGTALTTLDLPGAGYKAVGRGGYNNYFAANIGLPSYPDPRSNLDELDIDYSTVRVFAATGGGLFVEVKSDESFLRGATAAVTVFDDGDGDNVSPYMTFAGQDFTTAAAAAVVTGTADMTAITYGAAGDFDPQLSLIMSVDGGPEQTLLLTSSLANAAAVVAAINALWEVPSGAPVASLSGNFLRLTSQNTNGGRESTIRISSSSTALSVLGLTAALTEGSPQPPAVGDEVWVDGVRVGLITEVAPAGVATRLRLDVESLLTFTGVNFTIRALGLAGAQTSTRPSADLVVDSQSGEVLVKAGLFRTPAGVPTLAASYGLYLGFTAVRRDVSAAGSNATILRIGSLTDLEAQLSPINPENPLGLGMYFAMLNATGIETQGIGVSEISDDEPYGTVTAWAEAFEFVESKDVYAIAPLTHDMTVADLADAHVTAMSDPEAALERMVFFNPSRPSRQANTLVASGSLGNSTGGVSTFDTGIANLPALLAAAGFPAPPYDIDDRVVLKLDDDTNNYLVTGVAGSIVTVSTGALAAGTDEDNTDGYYFDGASPAFADPIVDRPFTVFVRGAELANLTEEAIAYAAIPQGYENRRMVFTTPDKAKATIDGLEQIIEGFYVCAALAGKTSSKLPQDPLTEVGIRGFTGVVGATDRYGEIQYRIMDGGGLWSMYQEAAGQSIKTRHQLTSDMSSIERREFSILTALDFGAKFIRASLRNFIGRFNLTTNVQDAISVNMEAITSFLVTNGVFRSFRVTRMAQSEDSPDRLLLDCAVGVWYPLNEIYATLVV